MDSMMLFYTAPPYQGLATGPGLQGPVPDGTQAAEGYGDDTFERLCGVVKIVDAERHCLCLSHSARHASLWVSLALPGESVTVLTQRFIVRLQKFVLIKTSESCRIHDLGSVSVTF